MYVYNFLTLLTVINSFLSRGLHAPNVDYNMSSLEKNYIPQYLNFTCTSKCIIILNISIYCYSYVVFV